ncbi:MAG: hypothetical protein QM756_22210 [Polyangiaceae bacterium]
MMQRARLLAALWLVACAPPAAQPNRGVPADVQACEYDVDVTAARPLRLEVRAHCRGRAVRGLESDDDRIADAIGAVHSDHGETRRQQATFLLDGAHSDVTFRYALDLDRLAAQSGHADLAHRSAESLIAPSSSFLLYPWPLDVGIPTEVRVRTPPGVDFATGLSAEGDHYRLEAHEIPVSTYSAFGALRRARIELDAGRASIDLVLLDGGLGVGFGELSEWARRRAEAVSNFYGGFPAPHTALFVVPIERRHDVVFGNLRPESSPGIALLLGARADTRALDEDWVLVHELFHIGVPSFHAEGKWFDEGLATYLEPIIRVRAGLLDPLQAWREFALEMPRGARALTRDGLERSDEMYWGGATFCLLADVEARRLSQGRLGLEDGVRNVLRAGGNASEVWPLEKTLRIADQVYPKPVLVPLWQRYAQQPAAFELEQLFRELGVERAASGIALVESAPLAWVRHAIFEAKHPVSASTPRADEPRARGGPHAAR